jgi:uracil-DNA glycosylase, family 4
MKIIRALAMLEVSMRRMIEAYEQLLDAVIQQLEQLKTQGVRYVPVSPERLAVLSLKQKPVLSKPGLPPSSRSATSRHRLTPSTPAAHSASRVQEVPLCGETASGSANTELTPEAKATAFAELRRRAMACVKCSHLASSRKNVVFGVGNLNAQLMFVGEAPGADEDKEGEPFVGKAGQLLTRILQTMGLSRNSVYIANILKCRPDTPGQSAGNRKPTPAEMQTCIPFLHEQIDLIQPRVLVALGATAVEGLLGKTMGITRLRGRWQTYRSIPLMPTYHPAYLLRNQALSEKRLVWEDMLQVMEKLQMPISEKQRNYFLQATN